MEIWKDIQGFEGRYQVSTLGQIKSLRRFFIQSKGIREGKKQGIPEKILTPHTDDRGYVMAFLYNGVSRKCIKVHRIVAKHFIPNPENLKEINHKDGNKANNSIENLEWCTRSENINHALKTGLFKIRTGADAHSSKKVTDTITGKEYDSIQSLCTEFHITRRILACRNKKSNRFIIHH